jgi:FAD/FMN-containing dehydrogenase
LGLTGFIVWAEIQLKPVISQSIDTETIKYKSLDDFFTISNDSVEKFEYTVAWLDCLAAGSSLGKGHFIRGNNSSYKDIDPAKPLLKKNKLTVPIKPPVSCINALTLRAFNKLYYERQTQERVLSSVNYDPFFYPLDGILQWNRIYGRSGFIQHQCVIPLPDAKEGIREMLQRISAAGLGSFLVVLKMMGDVPSRGLLSFPQEGATLAIDFPYQGKKTLALLSRLDEVVTEAKGKIYPAKDARMSAKLFQQAYPQWKTVESLRDPHINSDFWRRVTGVNV